ncbi:hypothetical protein SAICODRAFT_220713 [Saitoella complicata NRRL Y-17804]|uniref:uncharacterized protein n=1 Tax=Saitoella complicata (strain BCRC 22490 / CBS 7301 / JCM 7358 / NBRC 10748 / NRRL Y-17804) TaxID=698492 RepID=UPI0008670F60|nr:uncharacterized protein SAICODRAFT_220713 [Saitoella complicata NRRL Y-17804]ODQ53994.1 hypothetical protein SAICODRAFT_220713 [Saitoella complicata NRRL Y-17804]
MISRNPYSTSEPFIYVVLGVFVIWSLRFARTWESYVRNFAHNSTTSPSTNQMTISHNHDWFDKIKILSSKPSTLFKPFLLWPKKKIIIRNKMLCHSKLLFLSPIPSHAGILHNDSCARRPVQEWPEKKARDSLNPSSVRFVPKRR